jgi:hypothetical protein
MHKILIYLHMIHLLKFSTCFEHYPTRLQEAYVIIVYMQPLVLSLSAGDCLVHWLRKNCFPFVAVCCYLSLTGLLVRQLANGLRIPGGFCIVVHWVVFLHSETLALDLFCNGWLHFSFFGILGCYRLFVCCYRLVLVVWSCRFYYTSSFLTSAQDSHLQRVMIPEATYIQLWCRPPEDDWGNARNM